MEIGILVAGPLSEEQKSRFGTLSDMFEDLLADADADLGFVSYDVYEDDFPESPTSCDGWIITGSVHSAYENLPWMQTLEFFIRQTLAQNIPMVGICFGHQIMAKAMGGTVKKEGQGLWGAAVHDYELDITSHPRPEWMSGDKTTLSLQASHQDQVIDLPPTATRLGGNAFCPNGMLAYGTSGLSMQLHPELSNDFIRSLIEKRYGQQMKAEQAEEALARVDLPVDDTLVAGWIANFFHLKRN